MKASMSVGISGFERWALVCPSTIEGAAEAHCRVQVPLSNCQSSPDQVLCFLSPCGLSRNPTGSTASGDTSSQARSRWANPVFLLFPHSLPVVFLMIHWSQRHHSPGSLFSTLNTKVHLQSTCCVLSILKDTKINVLG